MAFSPEIGHARKISLEVALVNNSLRHNLELDHLQLGIDGPLESIQDGFDRLFFRVVVTDPLIVREGFKEFSQSEFVFAVVGCFKFKHFRAIIDSIVV